MATTTLAAAAAAAAINNNNTVAVNNNNATTMTTSSTSASSRAATPNHKKTWTNVGFFTKEQTVEILKENKVSQKRKIEMKNTVRFVYYCSIARSSKCPYQMSVMAPKDSPTLMKIDKFMQHTCAPDAKRVKRRMRPYLSDLSELTNSGNSESRVSESKELNAAASAVDSSAAASSSHLAESVLAAVVALQKSRMCYTEDDPEGTPGVTRARSIDLDHDGAASLLLRHSNEDEADRAEDSDSGSVSMTGGSSSDGISLDVIKTTGAPSAAQLAEAIASVTRLLPHLASATTIGSDTSSSAAAAIVDQIVDEPLVPPSGPTLPPRQTPLSAVAPNNSSLHSQTSPATGDVLSTPPKKEGSSLNGSSLTTATSSSSSATPLSIKDVVADMRRRRQAAKQQLASSVTTTPNSSSSTSTATNTTGSSPKTTIPSGGSGAKCSLLPTLPAIISTTTNEVDEWRPSSSSTTLVDANDVWREVDVDVIDMSHMPDGEFKFIFHCSDPVSLFSYACPLANRSPAVLAAAVRHLFFLYGPARRLNLDAAYADYRLPELVHPTFADVSFHFRRAATAAAANNNNNMRREASLVRERIYAFLLETGNRHWANALAEIKHAHNTEWIESIGNTPMAHMFGRCAGSSAAPLVSNGRKRSLTEQSPRAVAKREAGNGGGAGAGAGAGGGGGGGAECCAESYASFSGPVSEMTGSPKAHDQTTPDHLLLC